MAGSTPTDVCRTAGSSRSFTAIRKDAVLCCGSRLRSGEVFASVRRNQNPQNLEDVKDGLRTQRTYCILGETSTHPNFSPVAASLTILGV